MESNPKSFSDVLRLAVGQPRVHPNGFVQLDLDYAGRTRLHLWTEQPLQAQRTRHTIHDHIFDMESTVLKGALRNFAYHFEPYVSGAYQIFSAQNVSGGPETDLRPSGLFGDLYPMHSPTITEGNWYMFPAFEFHTSSPVGLTMTVMRKVNVHPGRPRVIVPRNVEPDNDFRRDTAYPTEQLWRLIQGAFGE